MAWITESNRWKHLSGGFVLGLASDGWWCAALVGTATGGALEFKDWSYGSEWDWWDFALTVAGAAIGQGLVAAVRLVMSD